MVTIPTGTVAFLFSAIEGSMRLQQQLGDRYADVLSECRRLHRTAIESHDGREVDIQGDGWFFAFPRAKMALSAAVAALRAINRYPWPGGISVRVRMSLHASDPLRVNADTGGEDVRRAVSICAAGHGGQILASHMVRDLMADDLPKDTSLRDLGEHRLKDLALPQHLFQVIHPQLQSEFPPLRSLNVLPNNLPIQLTSFIGREREISQVKGLLSTTRLLTLTGAGGAGKTRLASQVAAEALDDFPDGVWMVDLAPLADPALVPQAVAAALSAAEQPGRPLLSTLGDALRYKSLLLVLDNCEHLQAASAQLAEHLLRSCQALQILATSRVPLSVSGETLWRIPSLSLPDPRTMSMTSPSHMQEYEAIQLFVERARASHATFTLTPDNAPAVAQICQRLDGMALAIELAAARTRALAVEQIAAKLDDRFRLLTGGSSSLPRHQTLRATMDWSYGLLGEKEQILLRRLSVFVGGWNLEAAEAICSGDSLASVDILDVLMQLVDKSLITVDAQRREARYRLLETVRQFGEERLEAAGERATLRRRHRDWFLNLAELADSRLRGPEENLWVARLEAEHDNLRAALDWCTEDDGANLGLRLARALEWFWFLAGHWSEGRVRLEQEIERSTDAPLALLPKVLVGAARLAFSQGDSGRAKVLINRGLTLSRELGDKAGTAWFLIWRGILAVARTDYVGAIPPLEESLALNRDLGDKWWTVESLVYLGIAAAMQGDYRKAETFLQQSLALSRETENPNNLKWSLRICGLLALREKDFERGEAFLTETLRYCRDPRTHGILNPAIVERTLEGLAQVASGRLDYARAVALFGAAEALRETLGATTSGWVPGADNHDRYVASARSGLGDAAFVAGWAQGRAMSLEQTIEYALTPAEKPPIQADLAKRKADGTAQGLTAREREVAALVALGLTNRDIAERLVVAERTAETHIQNILNKLGFTSRAQIAAWAAEHGLARSTMHKS